MTNKEYKMEEIIIDGVNVAECRHCMYKGFKAFPQCRLELDGFATACTQHKECEYKQLKRLEQENAELRERQINWYNYEVHKYQQALEEIRKVVERTDFCHLPSVANLISVIRHEINEVLGND